MLAKSPRGRTITCDVTTTEVYNLVATICAKANLAPDAHYLTFEGRRLDSNAALRWYGIRAGSEIVIVPRLLGGGCSFSRDGSKDALDGVRLNDCQIKAPLQDQVSILYAGEGSSYARYAHWPRSRTFVHPAIRFQWHAGQDALAISCHTWWRFVAHLGDADDPCYPNQRSSAQPRHLTEHTHTASRATRACTGRLCRAQPVIGEPRTRLSLYHADARDAARRLQGAGQDLQVGAQVA